MYGVSLMPRRTSCLYARNSSQFCSGSVQVTPSVLHQCAGGCGVLCAFTLGVELLLGVAPLTVANIASSVPAVAIPRDRLDNRRLISRTSFRGSARRLDS